jgi:hypothetical protein
MTWTERGILATAVVIMAMLFVAIIIIPLVGVALHWNDRKSTDTTEMENNER